MRVNHRIAAPGYRDSDGYSSEKGRSISNRARRGGAGIPGPAGPDQRATSRGRSSAGGFSSVTERPRVFLRNRGGAPAGYSTGRSPEKSDHRSNTKAGGRTFQYSPGGDDQQSPH